MADREPSREVVRQRRARAARKYKPERVRLLLIAEAPPSAPDRYFYFEDVTAQDSLFRYVTRGLLGAQPTRENKPELLEALKDRGVFLIDVKLDQVDSTPLEREVPGLLRRVRALAPERIILIKATVYDVALGPLSAAGLPVVNVRVPFPGSGQQRRFETAFAQALRARPL